MQPMWLREPPGLAACGRGAVGFGQEKPLTDDALVGGEIFKRIVSTDVPDSQSSRSEEDKSEERETTRPREKATTYDGYPIPPMSSVGGLGRPSLPVQPPPLDWTRVFTVMVRNVPNKLTQQLLVDEMTTSGFDGLYDFLYLPIDNETGVNKGYAFINFVEPSYSWMFRVTFDGRKLGKAQGNSQKLLTIQPAALQGFEANYAHYASSRVNRGHPSARPLFLKLPPQTEKQMAREEEGRKTNRRGRRRHGCSLVDAAARQQQEALKTVPPKPAVAQAPCGVTGHAPWPAGMPGVAPLPDASARPGAGLGMARPAARFCHGCGTKMEQGHVFCPFCGAARLTL